MRKRVGRRLRPVRPSRANELWYRAQLGHIVAELRKSGAEIADELRPTWPRVEDERAPALPAILARIADRFGNIGAVAERLAELAVRKNLDAVDERLGDEIRNAVGIDIRPVLTGHGPIAEKMREAARANVELITSIPAQHFDLVREAVDLVWSTGTRWEALADRIREIGDITDRRARIIARDQTAKMNSSFNEVRQRDLGIERYTWSGALDQRERASHRAMEGSTQRWDAPPEVDGERVHPGQAILCRCVAIPLLDLERLEEAAAAVVPEEAVAA
jgi:SPP1 gp7 family putative phage head morphogenesis protein